MRKHWHIFKLWVEYLSFICVAGGIQLRIVWKQFVHLQLHKKQNNFVHENTLQKRLLNTSILIAFDLIAVDQ